MKSARLVGATTTVVAGAGMASIENEIVPDMPTSFSHSSAPHELRMPSLLQSAPHSANHAGHILFDESGQAAMTSMIDSGFLQTGSVHPRNAEVGNLMDGVHSIFSAPVDPEFFHEPPRHRIHKAGQPASMVETQTSIEKSETVASKSKSGRSQVQTESESASKITTTLVSNHLAEADISIDEVEDQKLEAAVVADDSMWGQISGSFAGFLTALR